MLKFSLPSHNHANQLRVMNQTPNIDGKYLFSGKRFRKDGPHLLFDQLDSSDRVEMPLIGREFTMQRLKRRMCIGRYDLLTSVHECCPNHSTVDERNVHCRMCEQAIGFVPAFYNIPREQIPHQQQLYNKLPHVVYLAWFGPGMLKVGISSRERRYDRWLEQGVIGATVVFNAADAYVARELEATVSAQFGYREVMKSSDKKRTLFPSPDAQLCERELGAARWQIARNISERVEQDNVFWAPPHYFASDFPGTEPIDLSGARPLAISGTGYGLVGDYLLMEQEGDFFCLRLKTVLAHVVMLSGTAVRNIGGQSQQRLI